MYLFLCSILSTSFQCILKRSEISVVSDQIDIKIQTLIFEMSDLALTVCHVLLVGTLLSEDDDVIYPSALMPRVLLEGTSSRRQRHVPVTETEGTHRGHRVPPPPRICISQTPLEPRLGRQLRINSHEIWKRRVEQGPSSCSRGQRGCREASAHQLRGVKHERRRRRPAPCPGPSVTTWRRGLAAKPAGPHQLRSTRPAAHRLGPHKAR